MSDEFMLPDMLDVSPEAVAAAEATLDPTLHPPDDAVKTTDKKTQDIYYRWPENLVIEQAQSKRTKSGLTEFFVRAKVRLGDRDDNQNVGKNVYSRYRVNFRVLTGQEENPGHSYMNRLSMASLLSLFKSTGFMPTDSRSSGLTATFFQTMFPAESDINTSPLVGKTSIGTLVDRPNKGDNVKYDRQTEVETWLPAVEA